MRPVSFRNVLIVSSASGLYMGLIDFIVQALSGRSGVRNPELTLPAIAFAAGIVFIGCMVIWIASRNFLSKMFHVEPIWSLVFLFHTTIAIGIWFEFEAAYPFLRHSILRDIIIASILILIGSLAWAARQRSRGGEHNNRSSLMLLFPASTMLAASIIWFYINEIEARWGVKALNTMITVTQIAGLAVAAGASALLIYRPFATRKIYRFSKFFSILSLLTLIILGIAAVIIVNHKYKLNWLGWGNRPIVVIGCVALILGGLVTSRIKGPQWVASLVFPMLFMVLVLSPVGLAANHKVVAIRTAAYVSPEHRVRHVIFILVDTLRADALGCYSSTGENTPHIDTIASDGVLFRNVYAEAPWTLPSVASVMTGLAPSVHRVERLRSALPPSAHTLAEYLQADGYYTSAIGRNPILRKGKGFEQGFEDYNFYMKKYPGRSFGSRAVSGLFPEFYRMHASTADLSRIASKWVETHYKKDFFLWLHFYDPHSPYEPPPDFMPPAEMPSGRVGAGVDAKSILSGRLNPNKIEREWIRSLYRGEVRYVDHEIGEFLNTLKAIGIYEDALIVFLSDHGEEHWDHGHFGHGQSLYNELVHVPLIIKPPRWDRSRIHPGNVSLGSLFPTVLDFLGIGYEAEELTAKSIVGLLAPEPADESEGPMFFELTNAKGKREGVIFQRMKYFRHNQLGLEYLTNLDSDAGEQNNIVDSDPVSAQRAKMFLAQRRDRVHRLRAIHRMEEATTRKMEPEAVKVLRDLGYIGN